jgi:hypothetical protein
MFDADFGGVQGALQSVSGCVLSGSDCPSIRPLAAPRRYDKTVQETEAAYMKILESSQTLLHVLKRETVNLTKKKQTSD